MLPQGENEKLETRMLEYIEFAWQGFGSWGVKGVASVRSCWKLPPCLTEPMPAGSKMDPLLAKAEPISDGGHASRIMYLRRGEKEPVQQQLQLGEMSENM